MYQRLFIGNKTLKLKEVDSTNSYLKKMIAGSKELEGLVVTAESQIAGRGQKSSVWESEIGKNLTFSILLKPNVLVQDQFLISKVVSLGIISFLEELGLNNLKIKWPNDIYCKDKKIAGILIENTLKGNSIENTVVGIGLNVNQINFISENDPTSIAIELRQLVPNLERLLEQLLFFIEVNYIALKLKKVVEINRNYLDRLYWMNEFRSFRKENQLLEGTIVGVDQLGRLQLRIDDKIEVFNLKEISFFK